jgi:hypothetical protein
MLLVQAHNTPAQGRNKQPVVEHNTPVEKNKRRAEAHNQQVVDTEVEVDGAPGK